MKKIFTCATVLFAAFLMFSSCNKDDNRDPKEVANLLIDYDWQGYQDAYKKNGSSWVDNDERTYNVLKFKKSLSGALSGTGYLLQFESEYMNTNPDVVNIIWRITDDRIEIEYDLPGWKGVYINFNDAVINENSFKGEMFDRYDHKYVFNFAKKRYSDWDKYFK